MCRHCNRWTFNDYYGFCGSGCCADFAYKHNLLFDEAKCDLKDGYIEELEIQVSNAESEAEYFQTEAEKYYHYEEKCETLEEKNALLSEFKYTTSALEAHMEMERVKKKYFDERCKVNNLREKIDRMERVCKRLRKINSVLNGRYTRFEAMDFS